MPARSRNSAIVLALALSSAACGDPDRSQNPMLHVDQGKLVDGHGDPIALAGILFGNGWFEAPSTPDHERLTDQDSADYARVAALGMNFVQFYVDARSLEPEPYEYSEAAFEFIDRNLEWAREHGLYLMLSLAVPPGGAQDTCSGDTIWTDSSLADRTSALWEELATRYRDEPSVAGYRLLRDPLPSGEVRQWHDLATDIVGRIRAVDPQHLILLDRAAGDNCVTNEERADLFAPIEDGNLMQAFAFRRPYEFTGQLIDALAFGEQGAYPDDNRLIIDWSSSEFRHASWDSRPAESDLLLKPEETAWTEKRFWYTITDPTFQFAFPDLQSRNNSGTVYFDDILVKEYDENGDYVATVVDYDVESTGPWFLWQPPGEHGTGVVGVSSDSHRGQASVTLANTTTDAALSASQLAFRVTLGHTYEVTSWIKGEDTSDAAESLVRLDFWSSTTPLAFWNREGLARIIESYGAWGREHGQPMLVSEFGTSRQSFDAEHGGLTWVEDTVSVLQEDGLHFSFTGYRDDYFGLYPAAGPTQEDAEIEGLPALLERLLRR